VVQSGEEIAMKQSKDYFAEQGLPEAVAPSPPVVRSLVGQKAIVTGANSGIGRAIALALGHAGADVVVNYVSRPEEAQKVVADIEGSGARAFAFKADVSQEAEVQAMFARAVEVFGAVDVMVNNAGLQKDAPFEELSVAAWDLVMNVNLKGQFLCAREAVRAFKR
jgi:glucose 1-dehydrogenase